MNYIVMRRSYVYNDEYYRSSEDDSGHPIIVFTNKKCAEEYAIDMNIKTLSKEELESYIGYGESKEEMVKDFIDIGAKIETLDLSSPINIKNCSKEDVMAILKEYDLWFYNVVGVE